MSNLIYLVLAVVLSLAGSLILWFRNRQPKSMDAGIRQFSRGLEALAPDADARRTTIRPDETPAAGHLKQQGDRRSG